MSIETTLQRTPLYEEHIALKARMVPFGGWEMPVQYEEGILAEHAYTRNATTLFDTCHMGEFVVEGDCQKSGLDCLVTMAIADMPLKTCRYGMLLNDQGTVMDDLIVFREEQEKWFIVVNGATTAKDKAHFQKHLTSSARFQDISSKTGKIDVQGPQSRKVLSQLVDQIEKLDYYSFDYFSLLGMNVLISRTGYTGELGYEIYLPWEKTVQVWKKLLSLCDVKPAGLGARDILRLEVGYSLYGHEINESITPLEAGLSRFVDFNKDFIGKEALLKQKAQGLSRKLIGFCSLTRRSPREKYKIYSEDNQEIGFVTSGAFSPSLDKGIGLGYVSSLLSKEGTKIFWGDEKNKNLGEIAGKVFYKRGTLKA
jgi:aminomethyltransferase